MKSLARLLLLKIGESRFLTLSLLLHVAFISALGGVVLFKSIRQNEAFVVSTSDGTFFEDSEEMQGPEDQSGEFEEPYSIPEAVSAPVAAHSAISSMTNPTAGWNTVSSVDRLRIASLLEVTPSSIESSHTVDAPTKTQLGGGGKSSSFSFMGIKSDSRRVAFLLDVSGSMVLESKGGGEAYADLKEQLISLVDGLDPETEFNVIMFGAGAADLFQPKAVAASNANVGTLKTWLKPYMREKAGILNANYSRSRFGDAWGTTRLDIALTAAFEMQAETLFILTDGTPNVERSADAEVIKKWEDYKLKNKTVFDRYEKRLSEYKVERRDEIESARRKAAEMNASLEGRTRERFEWEEFAPNFPKPPPQYYRPHVRVDAKGFNAMLKEMYLEKYAEAHLPVPAVNIVGYYVSKDAEDFLKDMTKGMPGKYKSFKK